MFEDSLLFVGALNAVLGLFGKVAATCGKKRLTRGDQLEEQQNAQLFHTTTSAESKLMKYFKLV